MLILVGSPAMLSVERHQPGATITSYGDALWWGLTSVIPAVPCRVGLTSRFLTGQA